MRPKRLPRRAPGRSVAVTKLAAVMTGSFMAEDERAVQAAEASVELEHILKARRRTWLADQAGRHSFGRRAEPGRAGQETFLHGQNTENGFDHSGRAERVAKHTLRRTHR